MKKYFNQIMNPEFYIGSGKENYFEGWYFKHECADIIYTLIPGISQSTNDSHAFIQLIKNVDDNHFSKYYRFPLEEFDARSDALYIKIGNNEFSPNGINVHLDDGQAEVHIKIAYEQFTPLKKYPLRPSIMGIFSYIPNMECNHGLISLHHVVNGEVDDNGVKYLFENGLGYIEKDWGSSFPQEYMWIQCENFGIDNASFMFSMGRIPFLGKHFNGFICILECEGIQRVFATYNGSKVKVIEKTAGSIYLLISNHNYELFVEVYSYGSGELSAPNMGNMERKIRESMNSTIFIKLYKNSIKVFEGSGRNAGFEICFLKNT